MKTLIIVDNVLQYQNVKILIEKKKNINDVFDFRHSPGNSPMTKHKDFVDKNLVIDVKKQLQEIIENYSLVISLHCLQYFPKQLVESIRCINIHPGYNPINRGWYPQAFAIVHNLPIGATIHIMDDKLDHGPIIARKFVTKEIYDSSLSLYNKVLHAEIELLEEYFDSIMKDEIKPFVSEEEGNIFFKKDYNNLCEIDLNEKGTFLEFYNRLRALTHYPFKNAYFINSKTGGKVYLSLNIENEDNKY